MSDKVYIYKGDGEGVPGLPHRITFKEAKERGVLEILKSAIAQGLYVEEKKKEVSDG